MERSPIVLFKPKDAKASKAKDVPNVESSIVATQRKHFRELSIEKMNGATYSWQIRDPQLISQILNCENKDKFTSEPFRIGELEFCLELYPNGFDEHSVGLTDLFLKLLAIPPEWNEVFVNYRLFCNETLSSWTFIQKFKSGGFWGWHDGCLMFDDLKEQIMTKMFDVEDQAAGSEERDETSSNTLMTEQDDTNDNTSDDATVKKHGSGDLLSPFGDDYSGSFAGSNSASNNVAITFSSYINILRVHAKSMDSDRVDYEHINDSVAMNSNNAAGPAAGTVNVVYEKNLLYSNEYSFKLEWEIDHEMVKIFQTCDTGRYFESDIFYEMWNLRVSPNGTGRSGRHKNDGNLTLFLNLCCLPPKISRIKVRYVLSELSSGTKWKFCRDFTYTASLSGWPDGKLETAELYEYETLKFVANIYITKMYDLDGKQIDIHHNDSLTEIKEDEQIDALQPQILQPENSISRSVTEHSLAQLHHPLTPEHFPSATTMGVSPKTISSKSVSPVPANIIGTNPSSSSGNGLLSQNQQTQLIMNSSTSKSVSALETPNPSNGTPTQVVVSPTQSASTHTHNITINNNDRQFERLQNRVKSMEHQLDSVSKVVYSMQRQMNELMATTRNIERKQDELLSAQTTTSPSKLLQKSNEEEERENEEKYRNSLMMSMLYEIHKEVQSVKSNMKEQEQRHLRSMTYDHRERERGSISSRDAMNSHPNQTQPAIMSPDRAAYYGLYQGHRGKLTFDAAMNGSRPKSARLRTATMVDEISSESELHYHREYDPKGNTNSRGGRKRSKTTRHKGTSPQPRDQYGSKIGVDQTLKQDFEDEIVRRQIDGDYNVFQNMSSMELNGDDVFGGSAKRRKDRRKGTNKSTQSTKSMNRGTDGKRSRSKRVTRDRPERSKRFQREKRKEPISVTKNISQTSNRSQREYLKTWLRDHVGLPQYYTCFVDHGVEDFGMVTEMTVNELKLMGVHSKKHQLQIQKEIGKLRNSIKARKSTDGSSLFDTV